MPQSPTRRKFLRQHDPVWANRERTRVRNAARRRYRKNPAWRAVVLAKRKQWVEQTCTKIPEYRELMRVRSSIYHLREKVKYHLQVADEADQLLLQSINRRRELVEICRGKGMNTSIRGCP
jgi:hypothetical protein